MDLDLGEHAKPCPLILHELLISPQICRIGRIGRIGRIAKPAPRSSTRIWSMGRAWSNRAATIRKE
jgi:hypothetical protein